MASYYDAYVQDATRLLKEYQTHAETLKKNPSDKKAKEAMAKLKPFLTKESLAKREEHARKLDAQHLNGISKTSGLGALF